jgi:calcineurin-like phosphoesterase family protein
MINYIPEHILHRIEKGDFLSIGDNHFGHQKCFTKFEPKRKELEEDFDDFEKKMVELWNNVVSDNDIVIHVGDFCINKMVDDKTLENIYKFTTKLNGFKILIKGNHDKQDNEVYIDAGWDIVINKPLNTLINPPLEMKNNYSYTGSIIININGRNTMITHMPCLNDYKDKYTKPKDELKKIFFDNNCVDLIHGHSHSKTKNEQFIFNASVENINFTPISYTDIYEIIK